MARTPRHGHAPIAMRRVQFSGECKAPGDYYWKKTRDKQRVLVLTIPCGGGKWVLSEWTIDHRNECGAQWGWNGNEDKPTLTPSLHAVGIWHGWVTDGMMVEA